MKNLTLPIKEEIQHSAEIIESQNIVGRVLNTLPMELHLEVFLIEKIDKFLEQKTKKRCL